MPRLTNDQAAELTWQRLSLEHDPDAGHGLSADIVATCCDVHERPVISVIHIEDRRHWNLTVRAELPVPGEIDRFVGISDLVDALNGAFHHDYWLVIGPEGFWTVVVEVLESAKV